MSEATEVAGPRVFYTHVMKTGGTSLHRALLGHFGREHTYPVQVDGPPTVTAKTFPHLLGDLDETTRNGYRYFCVHQPAWVAFEAAPDAVRLTVLRDPVQRTISHLRQLARHPATPDDLEEIYADDSWRLRLADHQTQLFADTPTRHASGASLPPTSSMTDDAKADLARALTQFWETAIKTPFLPDESDLATAMATLERYDIVGVTERLDIVAERLRAVAGIELGPIGRDNTTATREPVPETLVERIAADNQHDLALYRRAQELSER